VRPFIITFDRYSFIFIISSPFTHMSSTGKPLVSDSDVLSTSSSFSRKKSSGNVVADHSAEGSHNLTRIASPLAYQSPSSVHRSIHHLSILHYRSFIDSSRSLEQYTAKGISSTPQAKRVPAWLQTKAPFFLILLQQSRKTHTYHYLH
jgi:hypothetical protein